MRAARGSPSAVLKPKQAIAYLEQVLEAEPRITVAGIAGPGDPFANPKETLETIRLIRRRFPDLLLCLATNGLGLPPHLDELAELQVSHVTLTVNAVDPEIGAKIYSWVRDGKVIYRGLKAAEVLLERQLESIRGLKARGITVKINTIIIPGINDHHVQEVATKMAELGVDILNCMPVFPTADTPFGAPAGTAPGADDRQSAGRRRRLSPRCTTAPGAGPTPWGCLTRTAPMNFGAACRRAPARFRPQWTGPMWRWPPRRACW